MKTKKLIVIITLGILIIAASPNGTVNININKCNFSNNISSTWKNSKIISSFNNSNEVISFPTIPVIVVYKSKIVGDTNSINPLKIDISDKDFGQLWIPIIKKSNYNFSVSINKVHDIKTENSMGEFKINGEINVSGHYKLVGTYSTKEATNLIVDKVLNDIYNDIKRHLK